MKIIRSMPRPLRRMPGTALYPFRSMKPGDAFEVADASPLNKARAVRAAMSFNHQQRSHRGNSASKLTVRRTAPGKITIYCVAKTK